MSSRKIPTQKEINLMIETVRNRIAEVQSLSPDTTIWLDSPRPNGAFQSILLLGAILLVSEGKWWESEKIYRRISNFCYLHQYEGEWSNVQELLENCKTFSEYREKMLERMNSQDFYGNYLPAICRWIKVLKPKREGVQLGPVKHSERRRGYNDHGTLRPIHTRYRNLGELTDERIDRRSQVLHPFIGNFTPGGENLNPKEIYQGPESHLVRKEGHSNVYL